MSTYILEKDLPDSKAGDKYIWNDSQKAFYKDGNVLSSYWLHKHVVDNPEWFREEVVPEWEILEYRLPISGSPVSVKRISDGEVFKTGCANKQSDGTVSQIIGFEIVGNWIQVLLERGQRVDLRDAVKWPLKVVPENRFTVELTAVDYAKLTRFLSTLKDPE